MNSLLPGEGKAEESAHPNRIPSLPPVALIGSLEFGSVRFSDLQRERFEDNPAMTDGQNAAPKRPPLVYIVDDERMVAEVVEAVLKLHHYQTRLFLSPEQAWEALPEANPQPDVLVTDYVMDGMNGIELIQHCKRIVPHLKTILCSGTVDEHVLREFPIRPDAFLNKPFLPNALLRMIKELVKP
jgi:CheY-like chemotaxis protein